MAFLAPIAPYLAMAGTAVSAAGSLQSGLFSAQVARNNQQIADQNAEYATQAGGQKADLVSRKGAARQGAVKAALAANNIDVNSGSAADVLAGERETGALDIATAVHNAALDAYGYKTRKMEFEAEEKQSIASGVFGAASDLLSGASSMGMNWGTPQQTGIGTAEVDIG